MTVQFHILDALSRDQYMEVTRETEEEQEVEYSWEDNSNPDISYGHASQGAGNKQCCMVIHLFGMTADGVSLRCDIDGFRPYLYVKVPPSLDISQFRQHLGELAPASMSVERVKRKELYGFTADEEFTFFKLAVASMKDFRALKNILLNDHQEPIFCLSKKSAPLAVYESGLDPLLRFFHLRDVAPCGWVSVEAVDDGFDEETDIRVIRCSWEDVGPEKSPPKPTAPFKALFWDIECYSRSGDFPVAKPMNVKDPGDPIIQIGCVLKQSDGSIQKTIFVLDTCDDIPGATVKYYATEKQMLLAWFNWLIEVNPDIWVGYNIFGFDEKYLWHRSEVLKITIDDNLQKLSRLFGHGGKVKLDEKRLASSALGDNFMHTLSLQGRLQVDLYHVVKRGYQLPSYKLDEVTKYFMSGKLKTVEHNEDGSWSIKTSGTGNAKVGRAVVLIDETGDELTDKLTILEVGSGFLKVKPSDADAELDTDLAVKWVIVKDDVSPADIFRLHRGSSADRATIAAYCIQDCDLTMELYNKLETFNNAMCMANVCTVPVTMIFTRGQGVKIESLIFKFCNSQNMTIVTQTSTPFNYVAPEGEVTEAQDSYEGAIVLDPTPGFYTKSPIGVCDFASLYPSIIRTLNISPETKEGVIPNWQQECLLSNEATAVNFNNQTIPDVKTIIEPFAGNGDLLNFIENKDIKIHCFDIDPKKENIKQQDTLVNPVDYKDTFVLTNPPYLARNKNRNKTIYDLYNENDLYKCFIRTLINNPPLGGIIIIPLNFLSSIRKSDSKLRYDFMVIFEISLVNIFEERVWSYILGLIEKDNKL